ncbi:TrkA C-terminal domain-containing protein [Fortiea contorta]|uniref:TrkA C-terminal domain-containing protein n=1 Tax=Fortiea contorta TaxID=1892405 RepID=UPI000346317A|nr:TrkA C-terminal domain-containing protein [Fortiea contorta]
MYKNYFFEPKIFTEPSLVSVFVQPNSVYCGINLAEISLPDKCSLLGITRNGNFISCKDNPTIRYGDYVLAVAMSPMMTPTLKVTLKKIHPLYSTPDKCLL